MVDRRSAILVIASVSCYVAFAFRGPCNSSAFPSRHLRVMQIEISRRNPRIHFGTGAGSDCFDDFTSCHSFSSANYLVSLALQGVAHQINTAEPPIASLSGR